MLTCSLSRSNLNILLKIHTTNGVNKDIIYYSNRWFGISWFHSFTIEQCLWINYYGLIVWICLTALSLTYFIVCWCNRISSTHNTTIWVLNNFIYIWCDGGWKRTTEMDEDENLGEWLFVMKWRPLNQV